MGIETRLDPGLWDAVRKSYEERNYTAAILDSIQYLGDVLRDKTGLASDGMSLVGEALSGNKPKLRINRFETETEKNVQSGIEHLVRGLYKTFRNPRSHEKHVDNEDEADVVLSLVTYLLRVIGQSKSAFDRNIFLRRVFDTEFVPSDKYATALALEVPRKYQFEILVDIYRDRNKVDAEQLAFMIEALWRTVSDEARSEFAAIVSHDLNAVAKSELGDMIKLLPVEVWDKCTEAARIRSEGILIRSIREGLYDDDEEILLKGDLGTLASKMMGHWLLKSDLENAVATRLQSDDRNAIEYICLFVLPWVPDAVETPGWRLLTTLRRGLEEKDAHLREALECIDHRGYDVVNKVDTDYLFPKWREVLSDAISKYDQWAKGAENVVCTIEEHPLPT
jgi:uncharacterized protein (TIGR02391 family)